MDVFYYTGRPEMGPYKNKYFKSNTEISEFSSCFGKIYPPFRVDTVNKTTINPLFLSSICRVQLVKHDINPYRQGSIDHLPLANPCNGITEG